MWILVIASGMVSVCSALVLRETYAPFLRQKEAPQNPARPVGITSLFACAITRPIQLLFLSPICTVMGFYMAL